MAAALDVLGEKWSLLVIRELAYGVHRFDSIAKNTGAPRDILTSRLRRLEAAGVVEKRQYHERPRSLRVPPDGGRGRVAAGALEPRAVGEALGGAAATVASRTAAARISTLVHTCRACGEEVTGFDLQAYVTAVPTRVVAPSAVCGVERREVRFRR